MRKRTMAAFAGFFLVGLVLSPLLESSGHNQVAVRQAPPQSPPPPEFTWPKEIQMAVSVSFDDARPSQLDAGVPLLDSYGVKATFYVLPSAVRDHSSEWKAVAKAGHEIGNHSLRHACSGNFPWSRGEALEDCTLEQMATELDAANTEIEKLLGVHPETFAYPCSQKFVGRGENVKSYVPIVASKFIAGRGWRDETSNDPVYCDMAQLMGYDLDGLTWDQLKPLIEEARERHAWLVLGGHDIGKAGFQTAKIETLRAFCEYVKDPKNGIWTDTVANISRYVISHRGKASERLVKRSPTRYPDATGSAVTQ